MSVTWGELGGFALQLALLSMFSIGGANVVLPEIHRDVVMGHHWMTDAQFGSLVALAQASPGPNVLVIAVLGFQLGGVLTGALTMLAFVAPPSILTYLLTRVRGGARHEALTRLLKRGLSPITAGLVLANGCVLASASGAGWAAWPLAALSAAVVLTTRLNPVWVILGCGAIGALVL
jgi:chromate transporter